MIEAIELTDVKLTNYRSEGKAEIKDLSQLNIFIGSNNSGKSRFLRSIFSNVSLSFRTNDYPFRQLNDAIDEYKREMESLIQTEHPHPNLSLLFIQPLANLNYGSIGVDPITIFETLIRHLIAYNGPFHEGYTSISGNLQRAFYNLGNKVLKKIERISQSNRFDFRLNSIYIPTLRGLRHLSSKSNDEYLQCTIRDYFTGPEYDGNLREKIYTGLNLYQDTQKMLLGDKSSREKVKQFEIFLSETFFDNKEVTLSPRIANEIIFFRIGEHEERPIFELGDGIQSIIILTYPLFFNQGRKVTYFIEEPEQYLHPGFQRLYIETLLKFPEFQYFITTHSNHFLDLSLDSEAISVYAFHKKYDERNEPSFDIENIETDYSEVLAKIGVRNSSVFLSNCTIWVEGITDRIYIRKFLDVIGVREKNFKEDLHYSFVEYGGSNITHWSFLSDADKSCPNIQVERLCGRLFLITDKDSESKAKRHCELKETLGERYFCLDSREIENTLQPHVIKQTLQAMAKNNVLDYGNAFNNHEEVKNCYLGSYIDQHVNGLPKKFAEDSGTIKDKLKFAKLATSFIKLEEDLSVEGKTLAYKILDFIQQNNQ